MVPLVRSLGLQIGEGSCPNLLLGNCQARLEGGWLWLQIQPPAPRAGTTGAVSHAGGQLWAMEEARVSLSSQDCGTPGSGERPGLPNVERGCPGVRQLQTRAEMDRVSTALWKTAAGPGKGLGQGLRRWIMRGDSCSIFILSWQRREGIAFPSAGTCPCRAAGSALMVHARKPAACHLADPHLFCQVSEPGVKSSLHAVNSTPDLLPSCGMARSRWPPQHPISAQGLCLCTLGCCGGCTLCPFSHRLPPTLKPNLEP